MKFLYLILSIAFNISSYTLYKGIAHKQHTIVWYFLFALGLSLGAINVLFFTKALKGIQLNVAYPVFSGSCIFLMAFISAIAFGEKLSYMNMFGTILIVIGIVCLTN